jgi:biopolymer transport protein ExbB/TolQ
MFSSETAYKEEDQQKFSGSPHTDINPASSLLLGILFMACAYVLLWITKNNPFSAMFFQEGQVIAWAPPLEVFLTSWALAIVVLKYGEHRKQERMFSSDILTKLPQAISPAAAREWVEEFQPRATQKRLFFAPHRISRLLAHFGQHCNRSDLSALLVSQSDIDVSTVNSSYSTLRVFIWAIPIVGFIGTVIGIGDAISGFAELNDPNQLQEQLRPITSGLAGAFETTLIALLFSIVLMFPTSWCQKIELRLLNRLDDFCNEQLLHRLRVDRHRQRCARNGGQICIDPPRFNFSDYQRAECVNSNS